MRRALTIAFAVAAISFFCAASSFAGGPSFKLTPQRVRALGPVAQRSIAGLQYRLNAYQLRQFFQLPSDSARAEWIGVYWKSLDPTPDTGKNEMRIEHEVRTRLASQFFKSSFWPGWDKRGEVFIRYGPPNYRGKIPAEVTARRVHPPGELWYYRRHSMIVSFSDQNLNGHYIYSISALGAARDMSPELIEFLLYETDDPLESYIPSNLLDFYREAQTDPDAESDWTPLKEAIAGVQPKKYISPRMRGLHEGMDEVVDPDTPNIVPDNPSLVFQNDKAIELANNYHKVLEETPAAYPFNFNRTPLPLYFSVDQFRGGAGINRVEINLEFEADRYTPGDSATPVSYTATAIITTPSFDEVARDSHRITLPAAADSTNARRLLPMQLRFSLGPGYYRTAVTVNRDTGDRTASYRTTFDTESFEKRLVMSDVIFASRIGPTQSPTPFTRGPLEVIPHPLRAYPADSEVPVYFEIYNLVPQDNGTSTYAVEYRIMPTRHRRGSRSARPVVSSRFRTSGYGPHDEVHLSFRTGNLREGTFDLVITVRDEMSNQVATRRTTFSIVP